jgi:hypothetical protein
MSERQLVSKEVDTFSFEYETLESILRTVEGLIESYGRDAVVRCERDQYSDSDKEYARVYMQVPETDAQMELRISVEERYAARTLAQEKFDYARLQAKFGDKNA